MKRDCNKFTDLTLKEKFLQGIKVSEENDPQRSFSPGFLALKKPPKTVVGPSQGGKRRSQTTKRWWLSTGASVHPWSGRRSQLLKWHFLMMVFRPRAEHEGDTVPSAHHSSKWFLPLTCTSSVIRVSLQQFPASSLLFFVYEQPSESPQFIHL